MDENLMHDLISVIGVSFIIGIFGSFAFFILISLRELSKSMKFNPIYEKCTTTILKEDEPSENYTLLQEKIFLAETLLMEKNRLDPMISLLKEIEECTKKIDQFIFEHPECVDSLRRYSHYYLPMLIKILDKFIDSLKYGGKNSEFRDEVQSALEDTNIAFKKILEILSHSMEIEASCDIVAYRSILEMDGVSGDVFSNKQESDGI